MNIMSLDEIRRRYNQHRALEALREGFQAFSANQVQLPAAQQFFFKDVQGDCCIKSAYVEGSDTYCVKISNGFYQNAQCGLPSNDGLNIVFSAKTGQPIVLLDDHGWLTGMRTALAGRIAAELMLPTKIERLSIFGTGLQAELQLRQLVDLTACRDVIIWGRHDDSLRRLKHRLADLDLAITLTHRAEEAARDSSIIVTATASRSALIRPEWVSAGAHITAIGADAPGKNELDRALIAKADLILVDSFVQCGAYGELSQLDNQQKTAKKIIEIGALLSNPSRYARANTDITIADLTGLGVQDAQISASILAHA